MLMPLVTTRLTGPPTVVGASSSQPPHTATTAASDKAMPRATEQFTLAYRSGTPDPEISRSQSRDIPGAESTLIRLPIR
jgi:hypothetical protein